MSLEQADKSLIDRYLNGELSGIDLENFRDRVERDDRFKNEVSFQQLLRSGILVSKEEELKKKILENIRYRKTRIPFALKLIVTFLVVTGIGISLWFYVGTESSSHVKRYLFFPFTSKEKDRKAEPKSAEFKNQPGTEGFQSANKNGNQNETVDGTPDGKSASESSPGMNGSETTAASKDSTLQVNAEDEDIVIKKEQLLVSTSIPVIEKPLSDAKPDAGKGASLAHDAVEKLNPQAGIPEEEKTAMKYQVEFWVSPINYHGYKMSRNKLIIYGIDEPDAVKLYRFNDALFMKYGNEFFRLVFSYDYIPYQRMKEADVPLAIRQ